jgi:hypothetical protein
MTHWINYLILFVLAAGLFVLLLSDSRRTNMFSFAGVMLTIFIINIQFWPFTFALAKLITGLMAVLILNLTPTVPLQSMFGDGSTGKVFKAVALTFGMLLILFTFPLSSTFLSITTEQLLAALFVIICGFIQLGTTRKSNRVILGILTLYMGFEIIYGSIERSLLINGLLAAVDLLIALVGSYILINSVQEAEE